MLRYMCLFMLTLFALGSNADGQNTNESLSDLSTTNVTTTNVTTTSSVAPTTAIITDATTTSSALTTTSASVVTTTTTATANPTGSTLAPNPGEPIVGTWSVTAGNTTCLKIKMAVQFKINETVYNLPNDSLSTKSSCGNLTILELEFGKSSFILTFEVDKEFGVKEIELSLDEAGINVETSKNVSTFKVVKDYNEYVCMSRDTVTMDNGVTITFEKVEVEYSPSDKTKGYTCDLDRTSDAVPIAVGCALAGLVIIVLIAYLVGRRRSRQRGYQSV